MTSYGASDNLLDIPEVVFVNTKQPKRTTGEENELLNGNGSRTSFKMQDAPFDRSGSEEDMLEYEDPIINCNACKIKRQCTLGEKILIAFVVIALIVIIALAAALGNKKEHEPPEFCTSKGCLQAASSLLGAMDRSADPCEDFHQYSCGGWLKETPIPPGYPTWDRFQELSYKNLYMLKSFIETYELKGTAENKAKMFYQSCMAESTTNREETLNDIRGLLDNLTSGSSSFDFPQMLGAVHSLSVWPLFQLTVGPSEKENTKYVIKIESGYSPFPYNSFKIDDQLVKERSANNATTETPTDVQGLPGNNGTNAGNQSDANSTTPGPMPSYTIAETVSHVNENVSELVERFLKETTNILQVLMNVSPEEAAIQAQQMLDLEKRLSLAHDIDQHIHNLTQAYNAMKISELRTKCPMLDWRSYLQTILGPEGRTINSDTEVIVLHEQSLLKVCAIVKEFESLPADKRQILALYMKLSVARSLKSYFDIRTFDQDISPDEELEMEGEHWRRCTFYTNKAMGFATGAIYVNGTSAQTSVPQVKQLVDYVKRAFKQYLLRKIWLDKKTKSNAAAKIDEMIEKVSYPTFIMNTTFVDGYYKQLTVGSDWFRNLLNWRAFAIHKMATTLTEKYDRTKSWINPPVTVESDYSPLRNDIIFPIAMFHLPIFSPEGPHALNFGAMGSVIGHEITHAFDIQGRQYDGFGRLRDWWDPVTAGMFNQTTTCMKDQYDRFTIDNMKVNGERTLEENIADNGGVRAAHIAYELWLNEHGDEQPLPGVDLTNKQIFYISFAQLFCSKWKPDGIKNLLKSDPHSPGPFRIEGALSNSLAFQDVFRCSYISKYNPPVKCQVW